jgi:PLP dependent protein
MSDDQRRNEIAQGLRVTQERIARACEVARRDPKDVTLVVVTKTFPVSDIRHLIALGVKDCAENRDQEARAKVAELGECEVRWQYIGQLQRKKAASVVRWADLITSVDRPELVSAIARAAQREGVVQGVCIQVNLDPPDRVNRGGVAPRECLSLLEMIRAEPDLHCRGLMAVAPYPGDPDAAFTQLSALHHEVLEVAPDATVLSAGMSGDLEIAIAHGATQVRIGGAILGNRPAVQ